VAQPDSNELVALRERFDRGEDIRGVLQGMLAKLPPAPRGEPADRDTELLAALVRKHLSLPRVELAGLPASLAQSIAEAGGNPCGLALLTELADAFQRAEGQASTLEARRLSLVAERRALQGRDALAEAYLSLLDRLAASPEGRR
jgi:hypothetical protein